MASKRKGGLGRPLDALLTVSEDVGAPAGKGEQLKALPVENLQRGRYQPRREFDEEQLEELAESIRGQGIIQPLIVRPVANNRYEIVAGERRWRAAQLAGLREVPAIVRKIEDATALAFALIENIQREDLNPIDEAQALARLAQEFSLTHAQTAEMVGRSRVAVTNLMRLLELAPEVKELLVMGHLAMGHARALLSLDYAQQAEAARLIAQRGLSARETENLVRRWKLPEGRTAKVAEDPNVSALERRLGERLGARVSVQSGKNGQGVVRIHYSSLEQLDGILERLGG